jgi:hypothetical protein
MVAAKERLRVIEKILLFRQIDSNLTVRTGRRPAVKSENDMMNGIHPVISFDLAKLAAQEQTIRLNRAMLIAEANRGHERRFGIVRSIRANFGGAIINVGQRVRGERLERVDATPSTTSLRIAR